jgi:hypothetical protein
VHTRAVAVGSNLAIEDTRMRLEVIGGLDAWRLRSKLHKMAATNTKSGRLQANRRRMNRATLEQHIPLCERGEEAGKNAI